MSDTKKRHWLASLSRFMLMSLVGLALGLWTLWTIGAFYYDLNVGLPQGVSSIVFLLACVAALIFCRGWKRPLMVFGLCALTCAWWLTIEPSHDRVWEPDRALLASAEFEGDIVTIHNVRDGDRPNKDEYQANYHDRRVQLSKITGADMFLCYWGSPWLAHPILSFRIADAEPICFSIETRNELDEQYSTIAGFYRQYELIYIVCEERDAVRERTTHRVGEDVYLFKFDFPPDRARAVFRSYLETVNDIHAQPRFYNVLTSNCTTNVRVHGDATTKRPRPWDWRILLPGKIDELIYMRDGFASELPLADLRKRGHVNEAANRIGRADDFSRGIRKGVPGFDG